MSRKRLTAIKRFGVWALTLKRDPCVYCAQLPRVKQSERPWPAVWIGSGTIEHIVPRTDEIADGKESWENLAGACRKCNGSRGNLPLLKWLLVVQGKHVEKERRAAAWQQHRGRG